ncbi:hypothetical protein SUGI_0141270 [Cryptomeria japonica]|nr:hypothetical protein SUGI_0141270 [Cryptomeria japonica]
MAVNEVNNREGRKFVWSFFPPPTKLQSICHIFFFSPTRKLRGCRWIDDSMIREGCGWIEKVRRLWMDDSKYLIFWSQMHLSWIPRSFRMIWLVKSWCSFPILRDRWLKGINPASFSLGMTGHGGAVIWCGFANAERYWSHLHWSVRIQTKLIKPVFYMDTPWGMVT